MAIDIQPGMKILAGKILRNQGTAGIIVKLQGDSNSSRFLSSAWHVLNPKHRSKVEVFLDDGNRVGLYRRSTFKKLVGVDLAFVRLDDEVNFTNVPFGSNVLLNSLYTPNVGDLLTKIGAESGETDGEVLEVGHAIAMERFAITIRSDELPSLPGDSGAIWYNKQTGAIAASHTRIATPNDNDQIYVGGHMLEILKLFNLVLA